MSPGILPILARVRPDIAAILTAESIRTACREAGSHGRNRVLDPVATVSLFWLQGLHGHTACRHGVHLGKWAFRASASCPARRRWPLRVIPCLVESTAAQLRSATSAPSAWLGHRVGIVDGSSVSMSDVPELPNHFGQPAGPHAGCGFPVAHGVALFDLATGLLWRVTTSPMRTHDRSQAHQAESEVTPGDLLLGDRGFGS